MAFGEAVAELVTQFFVEVVFEGLIKGVVFPVLRAPGVVLTGFFSGSLSSAYWRAPDTAFQIILSVLFWVGIVLCYAVR